MTPPHRLSFAVLVIASALVLAACGGSKTPTGGAEPTTSAEPAASAGGSPEKTTTPGKQGTTTSGGTPTPGSGGTTGPGASGRGTSPAPAPGTYTYAQSGETVRGEDYPDRGTLVVRAAKASAGGVEQEHVRKKLDAGDGETNVFEFRDDEVVVMRRTQGNYLCTLNPPLKVLSLPMQVGQSWTSHSECKVNSSITVTIEFTGSVIRRESKRIGGTDVDTFVLSSTLVTKVGTLGSSTEKAISWLSPKYKLVVRSEETSELSTGASGTFNEQLVSLEPKE